MRNRMYTALLALTLLVGAVLAPLASRSDASAAVDSLNRTVQLVVPGTVITATGTGTAATGFGPADLLRATVNCTAMSGTTPSYTFKVQDSIDGVIWNDLISFTALTTTGSQTLNYAEVRAASAQAFGDSLRASYTVTGTTPSGTCGLTVFAQG
jgi:hypothetical protein